MLIILPLYPDKINGFIYCVNLFDYTQTSFVNKIICLAMPVLLVITGIGKIILAKTKKEKSGKILTEISLAINILMVLYMGIAREAYAVAVAFLLLILKGIIFLKNVR